jgi:hypothetical protein
VTVHESTTPELVPVDVVAVAEAATAGWFAQVTRLSTQGAVTRRSSYVRLDVGAWLRTSDRIAPVTRAVDGIVQLERSNRTRLRRFPSADERTERSGELPKLELVWSAAPST